MGVGFIFRGEIRVGLGCILGLGHRVGASWKLSYPMCLAPKYTLLLLTIIYRIFHLLIGFLSHAKLRVLVAFILINARCRIDHHEHRLFARFCSL